MSFPRYPKYKGSGVEWLGEVPEEWRIDRIKTTVKSCRNGIWGNDPNTDEWDIACIRVADFDRLQLRVNSPVPTTRNVSESERKNRLLQRGDLLLEKSGGGDLQPVGCVVLADLDKPAVCSNFVARMSLAEGFNPSFCRYVHAAMYALRLTTRSINQTSGIQNLDQQAYLNEVVGLPLVAEQEVIAAFLDQETAKIDVLIEEQRRLIELLKEKRQAVISYAVTRGLDPSVKVKNTGIEWVPEMPSHWMLPRIADIFRDSKEQGSDGLPILSVSIHHGVSDKELGDDDLERVVNRSEDVSKYKRVYKGDLTYNMMRAWQGAFGAVLVDGMVSPAYVVARPLKNINSQFVERLLRTSSAIREMKRFSKGITDFRLRLYWEEFKNIRLPLPPLEEQAAILIRVDEVEDKAKQLTESAKHNIALLLERRSALISAAVTGKIDVRRSLKKPVNSVKLYNSAFAHQLLAATILGQCNDKHMGRVKLQKLIHVTEYHAQIEDLKGEYTRQLAGPLNMKAMAGLERGLEKQHWYTTLREGQRYRYQALEKRDQHKKYLEHWADKQGRIDEVLTLMGGMSMRRCELVSTLYAAWNDLLIDGMPVTDDAILNQAATAAGWHESKERTPREKWMSALQWMRQKALIPTGFGSHTRKAPPEETHESA